MGGGAPFVNDPPLQSLNTKSELRRIEPKMGGVGVLQWKMRSKTALNDKEVSLSGRPKEAHEDASGEEVSGDQPSDHDAHVNPKRSHISKVEIEIKMLSELCIPSPKLKDTTLIL